MLTNGVVHFRADSTRGEGFTLPLNLVLLALRDCQTIRQFTVECRKLQGELSQSTSGLADEKAYAKAGV